MSVKQGGGAAIEQHVRSPEAGTTAHYSNMMGGGEGGGEGGLGKSKKNHVREPG